MLGVAAELRRLKSAVAFAAVLDLDDQYDELAELNVADQAIVADTVDPEAGPVRRQRLAHVGGVGKTLHFSEFVDDFLGGGFVELAQRLAGIVV